MGDLTILAKSVEAGVFLAIADEGRKVFMFGHPEYDRLTLDKEYKRAIYSNWLNYYVYQQTPYDFIDTAGIVGK